MTSKNHADFSTGTAIVPYQITAGNSSSTAFSQSRLCCGKVLLRSMCYLQDDVAASETPGGQDGCGQLEQDATSHRNPSLRFAGGGENEILGSFGVPTEAWAVASLSCRLRGMYMGPQLFCHAHMLSVFIMCMCQIKYLSRTCCWLPTQTQQQYATSAPWPLKSAWRLNRWSAQDGAGKAQSDRWYRGTTETAA